MDTFDSLGLDARLQGALAALGYEEPTPIQRKAIPALLEGKDVLGQAATGTGKTAAFVLPMLHRLLSGKPTARVPYTTRALILVPTRELAMQVAEAVHRYGKALEVRATPIYGGQVIDRQIRTLGGGVDVVVATPGRALDHLRRRTLSFDALEIVVLDEADEMLDMGFAEDLEAILQATPKTRQTALFSATMPERIAQIARQHLRDPLRIQIAREAPAAGSAPRVRQTSYVVARQHKVASLVRILDVEQPTMALVFCRTRLDVDSLAEALNARGFITEPLHGGMSQEQRDRAMRRFRSGGAELLVATDVAARGLDIRELSHVVNYDVPSSPEDYVHRIGRTGRAGREGVAITLLEPREHRLLRNIEQLTRQRIETGTIPTVADLRARKLELTRAALREHLAAGPHDQFRVVVDALSGEFDIVEIALAAVKMAHEASGNDADEKEIPTASSSPPPRPRPWQGADAGPSHGTGKASAAARTGPSKASAGKAGPGKAERDGGEGGATKSHARPQARASNDAPSGNVARLYVGAGRAQGVRPADLVGAIANEAGITSRVIGAIEITDRFSLVELPDEIIDDVIDALKKSVIKGRKVMVRRDRDAAR